MKSEVFNNSIGSPYSFTHPKLTDEQSQQILAGLFEQLLIFDKIIITTNRINSALAYLISKLGINTVERLLDYGYLKIMLWTPILMTSSGNEQPDGSIDESVIYGKPPIAAGRLGDDDLSPEENIKKALSYFQLHRDRRRIFTRKALNNYIIPDGLEFSSGSVEFIINAYENNNLKTVGLPFNKESNQLNFKQRQLLLTLGHKVLETAILSKYNLKSYENYEHYEICRQNLDRIGKAYNISENTSKILELENLPDLRKLFLNGDFRFDEVFTLRNKPNAKYYRRWINSIGENVNAKEITKEYLNEIKGSTRFFKSNEGKFIKNLGLFVVSTAIGAAIAGPAGAGAGFSLGLLDTYLLDNLLKGKNPSMFVEDLKRLKKK